METIIIQEDYPSHLPQMFKSVNCKIKKDKITVFLYNGTHLGFVKSLENNYMELILGNVVKKYKVHPVFFNTLSEMFSRIK